MTSPRATTVGEALRLLRESLRSGMIVLEEDRLREEMAAHLRAGRPTDSYRYSVSPRRELDFVRRDGVWQL